jgi:hypothetical protein
VKRSFVVVLVACLLAGCAEDSTPNSDVDVESIDVSGVNDNGCAGVAIG